MTRELAPGIHHVIRGFVNAFLVEADDGLTIVDSGLPRRPDRFLASIRALGREPDDVRSILITHHHVDHRAGLAALSAVTAATVFAPAVDADIIRGERPPPRPNPPTRVGRLVASIEERVAPDVEPAKVDHDVVDGETLPVAGGVLAIHTPGHTAGQTSYLLPRDGGILFVGDAAGTLLGRPSPPVRGIAALFTEDRDEARRSFRKLAAFEFEVALVGHGRPMLQGAAERIRAKAGRLG